MRQIPIQAIPNQAFTIILDNNTWAFVIKTVLDMTAVSLTLNSVTILDSARAVAGALIIPSQYQEAGNFFFTTSNFELPFYTRFNVTQALIYVSADELAAFRKQPTTKITANYFNPIAPLPLRFSPQGYT